MYPDASQVLDADCPDFPPVMHTSAKRKRALSDLDVKELKKRFAVNNENYLLINEQITNLNEARNSFFEEQKYLFNELIKRIPLE